jgi:hypothetical protein
MLVINWQLATGNWQLQLATGNWQLATPDSME